MFTKWLTRVLAENEELCEKQQVAFMIKELSRKMYIGKRHLMLSIPCTTDKQLNQEDSDTLGNTLKRLLHY